MPSYLGAYMSPTKSRGRMLLHSKWPGIVCLSPVIISLGWYNQERQEFKAILCCITNQRLVCGGGESEWKKRNSEVSYGWMTLSCCRCQCCHWQPSTGSVSRAHMICKLPARLCFSCSMIYKVLDALSFWKSHCLTLKILPVGVCVLLRLHLLCTVSMSSSCQETCTFIGFGGKYFFWCFKCERYIKLCWAVGLRGDSLFQ